VHAAGPTASTPWREAELCAIDLELTGLDPTRDEIISFATLPIARGRVRLRGGVHRLVQPNRMPEAETIRIHGLRSEDLAAAPKLDEVIDELLEAIAERALVAHVADVEEAFLGPVLSGAGAELRNPIIDTAALAAELAARRGEPIPDRIPLTQLARNLGLPVHRPHEADGDALTTAQAFLALATQLDHFEPQTIGSLARLGRSGGTWARLRQTFSRLLPV
jgi:DNA polymerase III subunit epsilon